MIVTLPKQKEGERMSEDVMEMRVLDLGKTERQTTPAKCRWRYGLLVEDIEVEGFHCESYGVVVTDRLTGEERQARHVTVRADEALELLRTLARCVVTPETLADVIEDWLGR